MKRPGRKLTHVDGSGRLRMVDVGGKPAVRRTAMAEGLIRLAPATRRLLRAAALPKGDVQAAAQVAGIQAAKRTAELVPLCHVLPLEDVQVRLTPAPGGLRAVSEVRCTGKTGVEMEALTAVAVALLTVYDMCKAVDADMRIEGIRLLEKRKGDGEAADRVG